MNRRKNSQISNLQKDALEILAEIALIELMKKYKYETKKRLHSNT